MYIWAGKRRPLGRLQFLVPRMAVVTEEASGGWLPSRSSQASPCRVPGLCVDSGREFSRIQREK